MQHELKAMHAAERQVRLLPGHVRSCVCADVLQQRRHYEQKSRKLEGVVDTQAQALEKLLADRDGLDAVGAGGALGGAGGPKRQVCACVLRCALFSFFVRGSQCSWHIPRR